MCISLVFHDLASACLRCTTSSHSKLRRVVFLGIKLYHCARYYCCCLFSSFFVYLKKLSSFSHCSSFGETICGLRVRCCCFSVLWYDGTALHCSTTTHCSEHLFTFLSPLPHWEPLKDREKYKILSQEPTENSIWHKGTFKEMFVVKQYIQGSV